MKLKLPTYNGWPIVAHFSPLEGKWYLKTRRNGIPCGVIGKERVTLKECLYEMLKWFAEEENVTSN